MKDISPEAMYQPKPRYFSLRCRTMGGQEEPAFYCRRATRHIKITKIGTFGVLVHMMVLAFVCQTASLPAHSFAYINKAHNAFPSAATLLSLIESTAPSPADINTTRPTAHRAAAPAIASIHAV